MLKKLLVVSALALGILGAATAHAIPNLQIYIDGASWDSGSQTWVINSSSFKLWVISDGSSITDVKLTAAFLTSETGSVAITGSTTGSGSFTDPSAASNPAFEFTSADGAFPIDGNGDTLSPHGIFGPGTSFTQWGLGNFTLTDSPIADFNGSTLTPTPEAGKFGQINAYDVVITGYSQVHFDAFNHIIGVNHTKYVFAPFSHDGEGGGSGGTGGGGSGGGGGTGGGGSGGSVPEPMSILLLSGGMVGLLAARNRKN